MSFAQAGLALALALALAVAGAALVGCDDEGEAGEAVPTGVFQVTERHLDSDGCGDAAQMVAVDECPSCIVTDPFMALQAVTWVDGSKVVMFSECADAEECPEARDMDVLNLNTTLWEK